MQVSTLILSVLTGISTLVLISPSGSNAGIHEISNYAPSARANAWYQAAAMTQIVNDTPQVIDTRIVPEKPPVVILPPAPWVREAQRLAAQARYVEEQRYLAARNESDGFIKRQVKKLSYTQCSAKLLNASTPEPSVSARLLHKLNVHVDVSQESTL
jgi:hypothetical protein